MRSRLPMPSYSRRKGARLLSCFVSGPTARSAVATREKPSLTAGHDAHHVPYEVLLRSIRSKSYSSSATACVPNHLYDTMWVDPCLSRHTLPEPLRTTQRSHLRCHQECVTARVKMYFIRRLRFKKGLVIFQIWRKEC